MSSDLDLIFNTPNGFLNTTFNNLPVPSETLPHDVGVSVLIRSDNKIVMGGYSQYTAGSYITLSCYNTDGSLYIAFGVGGTVLASPTFSSFIVNDIILQPNDYIIVTGNNSSSTPSMFVARFTPLGNLDNSFGTGGYVIITPSAFGTQFDQCDSNSVILQPTDNYIVLGGRVRRYTPTPNKNFIALVRLKTDGSFDNSFGTNGNGTVYAGFNQANEDFCNCLAIQTDGKIVLGGVHFSILFSTFQNLFVSRFNVNGTLDTTFNSSGPPLTQGWLSIPNLPSYNYNFSSGLVINSLGQIIISSYITKTTGEQCFGLAAVTSNGILDNSFGTLGQTILDLSPTYNLTCSAFSNGSNALALQSDNKIVITGGFLNISTAVEGFSLARFDTSGLLDSTFGFAGLGYILSAPMIHLKPDLGYSVTLLLYRLMVKFL